jgi:flagellar protein FliL
MASEAAKKEHADPSEGKAVAAKAGGSDKLGLIVLMIVVLNTVAAAGMGYLFMQMIGRVAAVEEQSKGLEKKMAEEKKPAPPAAGKEFIPQELGVLYPLEAFLVNIASDRGPRFLQMKLELELDAPALEDEIALKRPALRDAIIVLLTSRNYAELRDPKGMKKLREDILRSVNGLLKSGQVKELYFTQFHFN